MLINAVAPFAGAWIEIVVYGILEDVCLVAPFAGAWIEIVHMFPSIAQTASLPSRERGLKLLCAVRCFLRCRVAPFAGAWIEIDLPERFLQFPHCRSLRGSVD